MIFNDDCHKRSSYFKKAPSDFDMTEKTLCRRNFLLYLQKRPAYKESILLKEPAHEQLTGTQIGQLHNEYAISRQLADVSGVRPVYTLQGSESHPILIQLAEESGQQIC